MKPALLGGPLGGLFALPLLAMPAAAHHVMDGEVPATLVQGLLSGLAHPVIGFDHLAFLLATGLVAGMARWGALRLLGFVAASLLGVWTGWLGLVLPAAEWLVAASVVAAGAALLARTNLPPLGWAGLLAAAGFAHGQAYAEAMLGAEATPVGAYLLGLALVQAALALGIAWLVAERPGLATGRLPRLAGLAVVVVGGLALQGLIAG
jgi:urease accessory protein